MSDFAYAILTLSCRQTQAERVWQRRMSPLLDNRKLSEICCVPEVSLLFLRDDVSGEP